MGEKRLGQWYQNDLEIYAGILVLILATLFIFYAAYDTLAFSYNLFHHGEDPTDFIFFLIFAVAILMAPSALLLIHPSWKIRYQFDEVSITDLEKVLKRKGWTYKMLAPYSSEKNKWTVNGHYKVTGNRSFGRCNLTIIVSTSDGKVALLEISRRFDTKGSILFRLKEDLDEGMFSDLSE